MPATDFSQPQYLRPAGMDEALAALARGKFRVLAGGTDVYPSLVGRPVDGDVLDITAIENLHVIQEEAEHFRLGAAVTWRDLCNTPLPRWMGALQGAAREVGGPQIQTTGTLGGNLCNASPAADGVPALMALEANVELTSLRGIRQLPLTDFIVGVRQTELAPDELLTAVIIPKPVGDARSIFLKLGTRRYLVISIAMVAVCLETDADDLIVRASVAVGACSPIARRLRALELALIGVPRPEAPAQLRAAHIEGLSPIDDVRADAAYRLEAAFRLVREALTELAA